MGIGARVCQPMGIVTEVHLLKFFGEQSRGKMKNVLVRLIQEKKIKFPSRVGNQGEFDFHGQK